MSPAHVGQYPPEWPLIAHAVKKAAHFCCERCGHPDELRTGYVLTVHHLDGDKSNCRWWNLCALCQRCHLRVQGRVELTQVWPFEHSEWFKPHAAGWYAFAYLGEELGYDQTVARLDELLALERMV